MKRKLKDFLPINEATVEIPDDSLMAVYHELQGAMVSGRLPPSVKSAFVKAAKASKTKTDTAKEPKEPTEAQQKAAKEKEAARTQRIAEMPPEHQELLKAKQSAAPGSKQPTFAGLAQQKIKPLGQQVEPPTAPMQPKPGFLSKVFGGKQQPGQPTTVSPNAPKPVPVVQPKMQSRLGQFFQGPRNYQEPAPQAPAPATPSDSAASASAWEKFGDYPMLDKKPDIEVPSEPPTKAQKKAAKTQIKTAAAPSTNYDYRKDPEFKARTDKASTQAKSIAASMMPQKVQPAPQQPAAPLKAPVPSFAQANTKIPAFKNPSADEETEWNEKIAKAKQDDFTPTEPTEPEFSSGENEPEIKTKSTKKTKQKKQESLSAYFKGRV
jgi:hypothetical protein